MEENKRCGGAVLRRSHNGLTFLVKVLRQAETQRPPRRKDDCNLDHPCAHLSEACCGLQCFIELGQHCHRATKRAIANRGEARAGNISQGKPVPNRRTGDPLSPPLHRAAAFSTLRLHVMRR